MPKKEPKVNETVGLVQGAYDNVELVPQTTKRERNFEEIVNALKAGKFFVLREKYSRNSVYVLLRNLKEKANIKACFGVTQTEKDGKTVKQFVIFLTKEKSA